MSKIVQLSLSSSWKKENSTYEMLNGDPRFSSGWKQKTFPVVSYVDHHLNYAINYSNDRPNFLQLAPTEITLNALNRNMDGCEVFELKCGLPLIVTSDISKVNRILDALDNAIKNVAKHLYVDGDFTALEGLQLQFEKEINEAFSNAVWRKDLSVVRTSFNWKEWLGVMLISKEDTPLLAHWKPKNTTVIGEPSILN